MSGIKYFPTKLNIENKTIILRVDLNVPIKNHEIQDFTRISLILPFLNELISRKSKIVILTHLGRPKDGKNKELSLMPVYKYLKKEIKSNLYFYAGDVDEETKKKITYLKKGDVLLLENIRFFQEESSNDELFAKKLANLGEIYINDAFSCSHRKQASLHKITKFINETYAGPLLKKEVEAIDMVIKNKKKPVTCIIGGSKISTKINVISNLIKNVDSIIIVGAMANNFLAYKGFKIGKSLIEKNTREIIKDIYSYSEKFNCKIVIPEDFYVSKSFDGLATLKENKSVADDELILDIGDSTIKKIEKEIDNSNTVLWNGPAGYFENENFNKGTNAIAEKISENTVNKSLISILGGGDTVSAINKIKKELSFTHLSTAGGAFLEYLEGKDLPGISVLK
ncbi:MAG: phosphoglycerate kinase [Pelagibacteraceae bacterium]|jgi:phosphoglycerate kinase